jgi:hypothetical protein
MDLNIKTFTMKIRNRVELNIHGQYKVELHHTHCINRNRMQDRIIDPGQTTRLNKIVKVRYIYCIGTKSVLNH